MDNKASNAEEFPMFVKQAVLGILTLQTMAVRLPSDDSREWITKQAMIMNSQCLSSKQRWEFLHYHMVGMAANIADDGNGQNWEKSNCHYHSTCIDDKAG